MSDIPILDDPGAINPNWLTKVLAAQPNIDPCQVIDMTREDLNQGAGFVSQLVRVRMHYDERAEGAPLSVIIKMAPKNAETREFGKLLGLFQREVAFYKHFAEGNPCNPPRAYLAEISDSADTFTMVIEDLGPHDQEYILDGCTAVEAHAVMTVLGRQHAQYWKGKNLEGHDWIPNLAMMAPALTALASGAVPKFLDQYGERMPQELRQALDLALPAFGEMLDYAVKDPNQTLCHMDSHLGNIQFQDGQPRFIDWQGFAMQTYSYDVSYFLNGNLTNELRRQNLDALLDSYHEALTKGGVDDIGRNDVTDAYHRQSAGQLVTVPLIMGAFVGNDERGRMTANAMLPRFFAAMEDSDAPKQLAELLAEARA